MSYYCNPIDVNYKYQFIKDELTGEISANREAADPSMIMFGNQYYIFASMTKSVWVSNDMVKWENHRLPDNLPLYDYAPDVRVVGEYVYFSASKNNENCSYFRTKDVINGPYEEIEGTMPFWDPNLFYDEGHLYFYWGCSNSNPLWGVELDPQTMEPIGERKALISGNPFEKGYERIGENHCKHPKREEEIIQDYKEYLEQYGITEEQVPKDEVAMIKCILQGLPFIEGPWMDKYQGKYYLQYAFGGTEYNVYGDGVYESESPLGPFKLAKNNPYSYKPGGFLPGAGHGSTMWDRDGHLWHASTMRISKNHPFERRVGIWPAGYDCDGELYCNQRYGDWPININKVRKNPWATPDWMLLSYGKKVTASSSKADRQPENIVDEDIQTWWKPCSAKDEWISIDLGDKKTVGAIQINFADEISKNVIDKYANKLNGNRYIDDTKMHTKWLLEGSLDGENFFVIKDKRNSCNDLSHEVIFFEKEIQIRYIKISEISVPYDQIPCISGIRVFGKGEGKAPCKAQFQLDRISDLDMHIEIEKNDDCVGYNILWGHHPEKLYHSCLTFKESNNIGALIKNQAYFVRVDSFNENGITKGQLKKLNE